MEGREKYQDGEVPGFTISNRALMTNTALTSIRTPDPES